MQTKPEDIKLLVDVLSPALRNSLLVVVQTSNLLLPLKSTKTHQGVLSYMSCIEVHSKLGREREEWAFGRR